MGQWKIIIDQSLKADLKVDFSDLNDDEVSEHDVNEVISELMSFQFEVLLLVTTNLQV